MSLFQSPVVPGWSPISEKGLNEGAGGQNIEVGEVTVSLLISLPRGGALGWLMALCPSRYFRAGFILKSTCQAIPAACSLKEFEKASQCSFWVGKGMSLTSRNCCKLFGKCWKREMSVALSSSPSFRASVIAAVAWSFVRLRAVINIFTVARSWARGLFMRRRSIHSSMEHCVSSEWV